MIKAYHFLKTRFSTLIKYRHIALTQIKKQIPSFLSLLGKAATIVFLVTLAVIDPYLLFLLVPIFLIIMLLLMILNDFYEHIEYLKKYDAHGLEQDKQFVKGNLKTYHKEEFESDDLE